MALYGGPMHPVIGLCGLFVSLICIAAGPASQPSAAAKARQKWENAVLVFGDETTGEWSLRLRDKDVDGPHQFHFRDLWKYDRQSKQWVKYKSTPSDRVIAPPAEQHDEPDQVLVDLPIDPETVGLFYARWRMDDVDGATFFRLGPIAADKPASPAEKPQPGQMRANVPVDKKHSVPELIPDPRVVCEKDKRQ